MDEKFLEALLRKVVREELKNYPTKEDLKNFATKEDLKQFATKEDLKKELSKYATKEDLGKMAEDFGSFVHDLIVEVDQKKADTEDVEKVKKRVTNLENKGDRYIN